MIDVAQAQLLDVVLGNEFVHSYCCVATAWFANYDLVETALDAVSAEVFEVVPRAQLQAYITGVLTIGEGGGLETLSLILSFLETDLNISGYDRTARQYLAWYGDADMDGVCNLAEYNAVVESPNDVLNFVIVAIDESVQLNGGGCGEPCFEEPGEGEGEGEEDEGEQQPVYQLTVMAQDKLRPGLPEY